MSSPSVTLVATGTTSVCHPNIVNRLHQQVIADLALRDMERTFDFDSTPIKLEMFKTMAGLDIQHVPYRGIAAVMPDLLGGRLTMAFGNISAVLPLVREGKLRALAVTSRKRSSAAPDIPTMDELGYPGFEAVPWFGLLAPAGTPPAIVEKIHREAVRVLGMPDVRKRLEDLGLDVIGSSPAEFSALIAKEIPEWAKVIKEAGIKASE